jgi:hypothetical protein
MKMGKNELCALLRLTSLIEQCRTLYRHPLIINILPVSTTTEKDIFFSIKKKRS